MKTFHIPAINRIGIFIPSFGRPHAMSRVVDNIFENTPNIFTIYFILEKEDQASIDQALSLRAQVIINKGNPCYADAINTAYKKTHEPYFFCGADDLGFHPGWSQNALAHMNQVISVIGTNDLGQIPIGEARDATHYLVKRSYIETLGGVIDEKNTVLYPYNHNYTDKEFVETAKARGVYKYVPESITEHYHWSWGKSRMDETYKKGFDTNNADLHTYQARQHLWTQNV